MSRRKRCTRETIAIAFDQAKFLGFDDPDYPVVMGVCFEFMATMVGMGLCNLRMSTADFNEMVYMRLGYEGVDHDNVALYNKVAAFVKRQVIACSDSMPSVGQCVFDHVHQQGNEAVILIIKYYPNRGDINTVY